ncbi:glycosyltransferase family 4 protein [Bryobacter aggregatus]|uniref:glycosyltransferase family 4 protein n=1 Tax=Bryobacter aggregatus TaxID=360054 RepID=UPI0004E213EE|nr:glycosyltransferase family 4 protein [Bryobacter aggregatus]
MARRRYVLNFGGPREELHQILPAFEHRDEALLPGETPGEMWLRLVSQYPPWSIAHTAARVGSREFLPALALAPTRMLAYDSSGERFHLHPRQLLASLLFLEGQPVHRIHLRPWRDDTQHFADRIEIGGRPLNPALPTVAVLSPYLPWPLSHGGAVRIFHMLREAAKHSNLRLLAFTESSDRIDAGPLQDLCTSITLVRKPEFRRLAWASLLPPEVLEYETPAMRQALSDTRYDLLQTEFTQLANYGGDILVEHDVTMDLATQEHAMRGTLASWWKQFRWQRFERARLKAFRAIAVMSEKDRLQVQHPNAHVIPNGVDLDRFHPTPEPEGANLLFIGSFRHFPNALAFRFLIEEFWPILRKRMPQATLTVVAGPQPELYYPFGAIPQAAGLELHSFVRDVKPLYDQTNLVLVPTPVSAGTNIKALEAMAMQRAILSTPSGINGLDLEHGVSAWVASGAEDFASSAELLLRDPQRRAQLAGQARKLAEEKFDWKPIGKLQEAMWQALLR